jgi:hypothetical protein
MAGQVDASAAFKGEGTHESINRSPAMPLDWATAATEARRQRDAAVKASLTAQHQQRRQERAVASAWSPQIEISRIRKP